jgi:hypothetical protein
MSGAEFIEENGGGSGIRLRKIALRNETNPIFSKVWDCCFEIL